MVQRQWDVLLLVGTVSLFRNYDMIIFTVSMQQIQRDLAISDANISFVTSFIQSGAIFSFFVALLADRHGRRLALLLTIGPFTLATFATSFVTTWQQFMVAQFVVKIFCQAEFFVAQVVIAEEFDAANRGWGIGALGALGAAGTGLALAFFGA